MYIELLKCKNSNNYSVEFNINNYLQNLFSPICNTTLLHEIGHSIQQSSHESASHGLTNISINNDIKLEFGANISKIIDGLTKISNVVDLNADTTLQAENFRKILLFYNSLILLKLKSEM